MKRSNVLMVFGLLAFVMGAGLVVLMVSGGGGGGDETATRPNSVLVAKEPLRAGMSTADAIAGGLIIVQEVQSDVRAADAFTDTGQLGGRVLAVDVAAGQQLRASQLRPEVLRAGAITIPEGKQAMAVQLSFVAGGAGYVGPGDRINLYANITEPTGPVTRLILGNVEVLDISNEVAPRLGTDDDRPVGEALTYLLAVDPVEAERIVFATTNAELWIALAREGAPAPAPTAGLRTADLAS
jgi:pilus assembly protein CpaB